MKSATWVVNSVNHYQYQVLDDEYTLEVNLETGACKCRKWQLPGIPCGHVIAVTSFLDNTLLVLMAANVPSTSNHSSMYLHGFVRSSLTSCSNNLKIVVEIIKAHWSRPSYSSRPQHEYSLIGLASKFSNYDLASELFSPGLHSAYRPSRAFLIHVPVILVPWSSAFPCKVKIDSLACKG
ncbi:transposase, MuDR, MULE transposase domain protein [Tanacetum coccineum]